MDERETSEVGANSSAGRGSLDGGLAQAVYDLKRRLADVEAKLEEEAGGKSRETENRAKKERENGMKPAAVPDHLRRRRLADGVRRLRKSGEGGTGAVAADV